MHLNVEDSGTNVRTLRRNAGEARKRQCSADAALRSAFQKPTRIGDDVRVKVYYIHITFVISYRLGWGEGGGGTIVRLPPPLRNGREYEGSMFELMGGARRSQRLARSTIHSLT